MGINMKIRRLEVKDKFDAFLISSFCFHGRMDDPEEFREKEESDKTEDWGAFTEDEVLAARIMNNKYKVYLDGKNISSGGIGAVSTLPEYRQMGAVREIFAALLPKAYENGEVISMLYPFNHAFYRKQGYDTVTYKNVYEMDPALLSVYKFDGAVTRWKQGEAVTPYLNIYDTFAKQFSFAVKRDEKMMLEHMETKKLYQERQFSYLFHKEGKDIAYLIMQDINNTPEPDLFVEECAWVNRDGFQAILAFLGRFTADYGKVKLQLPEGIDLIRILRTPRAYELVKTGRFDFMVRVINAKKLLEAMKKPVDCDFVIQISDELIEQNNGKWHVGAEKVTECDDKPDMIVSSRTLGQMAMGCISLDEAMLKPDLEIYGKENMLRSVFVEKKIFINEHF